MDTRVTDEKILNTWVWFATAGKLDRVYMVTAIIHGIKHGNIHNDWLGICSNSPIIKCRIFNKR